MARIRKDEGLTYGIYSGFAMRSRPGPFFVSTFTRVPEVGRLVEIVLEELERMRDEPIGDAEVESVKRQSAGVFVLSLETSEDVLDALVDLDVYGLPEDSLDTYRARVVATTTEDVNRQARERLHPDRIALVVVGPAEALREQLEAFGPVEVVQP
jgi:zinc protease